MRALTIQATVFATVVALLPSADVSATAWWTLEGAMALALHLSFRWRHTAEMPRRSWAWVAIQTGLLAALLLGASHGLDALHGLDRNRDRVSAHLGGLEFWFVLMPGLFSLALARLAVPQGRPGTATDGATSPGAWTALGGPGASRSADRGATATGNDALADQPATASTGHTMHAGTGLRTQDPIHAQR